MSDKQNYKAKFLLGMVAMTTLASLPVVVFNANNIANATTSDGSRDLLLKEHTKSSSNLTENLVLEELEAHDSSFDGCDLQLCNRC